MILTELKYRLFDSLLEDVRIDLRAYALTNRIEPQQLIKVAQKVSYELGLRINQTKETIVVIDHKKARLPQDFYVMNFALLCGECTIKQVLPQGTIIEEVPAYRTFPETTNQCETPVIGIDSTKPVCLNSCGNGYQLIQRINTETRTYKYMLPIKFRKSQYVDCRCPNISWMCHDEAYIRDGFIFTSLDTGNLYINYEGALEDEDGNLLVPDHPILNEFYEYAIKMRVLENIYLEGDATVLNQLQLIQAQLRAARNNATSLVNTPDFREMRTLHELNRKAFYRKFYYPIY